MIDVDCAAAPPGASVTVTIAVTFSCLRRSAVASFFCAAVNLSVTTTGLPEPASRTLLNGSALGFLRALAAFAPGGGGEAETVQGDPPG